MSKPHLAFAFSPDLDQAADGGFSGMAHDCADHG